MEGYYFYGNDLQSHNNRGVGIYVLEKYDVTEITVSDFKENVFVQITGSNNITLTIGIIYRSPNSDSINDGKLFDLLNSVSGTEKGDLLLLGDFNFPDIDWSTSTSTIILIVHNFLTRLLKPC